MSTPGENVEVLGKEETLGENQESRGEEVVGSPGKKGELLGEEKEESPGENQESPVKEKGGHVEGVIITKKDTSNKNVERLQKLQIWLDKNYPGAFLMPSDESGKKPKYKHKEGQYTSEKFKESGYNEVKDGCLLGLSEDLIVVDIDDVEICLEFEREITDFRRTVCCSTQKGRHYYFRKTEEAKKAGMMDGARRMQKGGEVIPIDIKNVTKSGTSGMISIPPSVNKKWVRELGISEVLDMPSDFVKFYKEHVKVVNNSVDKDNNEIIADEDCKELKLEEIKKLVSLLSRKRADDYEDWMKVGWCLYNMYPNDLLGDWIKFSEKSDKFKEGECERLWNEMRGVKGSNGLGLGSLHMWAKADDSKGYNNMLYYRYFRSIAKTGCSEVQVAETFMIFYSSLFTYTDKRWFYFDGTLWREDRSGNMVVRLLCDRPNKAKIQKGMKEHSILGENESMRMIFNRVCYDLTKNEYFGEKTGTYRDNIVKIITKLESIGFKDKVVRELERLLEDEDFASKLDKRLDLIGFTNGVWDLNNKVFRPATPDDYMTLSVGYPYTSTVDEEVREKIIKYMKQLHPNDEQREYLLKMFARQLYGDSGNELFHIHAGFRGSAGNGKSKFFEILECALGDYVQKFGVDLLVVKQRNESGRPRPELQKWVGRRILYCSEPNKDDMLNSGVMKDLTGGEKTEYRLLFSNTVVGFRPTYKMHIMCNDAPLIDGTDMGVKRRIRKIDYIARFVDENEVNEEEYRYLKDMSFIENFRNRDNYKLEFLRYIIEHYDYSFSYMPPRIIIKNSACYLDENNVLLGFVKCYMEYREEGFSCLKDIKEAYKRSEFYDNKYKMGGLKRDLEKILNTTAVEQKRVQGTLYSCVFEKYRLREEGYIYVEDEDDRWGGGG